MEKLITKKEELHPLLIKEKIFEMFMFKYGKTKKGDNILIYACAEWVQT